MYVVKLGIVACASPLKTLLLRICDTGELIFPLIYGFSSAMSSASSTSLLEGMMSGHVGDALTMALGTLDLDMDSMPNATRPFAVANEWRNALLLPQTVRASMPRLAGSWLRNFLAGSLLYYVAGLLWCSVIYGCCRSRFFKHGGIPSLSAQLAQIWVSQVALVWYTLMPTIGEWMAENGWTRSVNTVEEVGGFVPYLAWTALYLFAIEFCVYWIHRALHHPLIKWLHADHHKYNTGESLSPWAGLAFHPVDGMLQASPYVALLMVLPVHFWTFEMMLVSTVVVACVEVCLACALAPH